MAAGALCLAMASEVCVDVDWTYRARDGGGLRDGAVRDGATRPADGSAPDGASGTGSMRMRVQGVGTAADPTVTSSGLHLSEHGFESGQRECVGTLCLTGGLVP